MEKYCSRCKTTKEPLHKYSKNKSGIQYHHCRNCDSDRMREYVKTSIGRENVNQAVYRSVDKHKKKQKARQKLCYQTRIGNIIRPTKCSKCQEKAYIFGHHSDYDKPLLVDWVCKNCHINIHNLLKV